MFVASFVPLQIHASEIEQNQAEPRTGIILIIEMYNLAKEQGTESPWGHSTQTSGNSLPVSGEGGYTSKDLVKDGQLVQRRYYDGEGKADMDIDYTDHGNPGQHPKVPHRHDWYWPPSGPPSRGPGY